MHLVFAYIEKFRNIERQQYFFDKSYEVDLLEKEKSKYKIEISKKKEHFNIMKKNNVENITVVVGKNGAGKTAWIIAMSELLEAFDESAFIFIYADGDDFYIEYNQVWIMDLQGEYYGWDNNEASICKVNYKKNTFEMLEKNKPRNNKIAYILVRKKLNTLTHSYANIMHSNIARNGMEYSQRSIYYKFEYLFNKKSRAEKLNQEHLDVKIELDSQMRYLLYKDRKIHLVPEKYPGQVCFFESMPSGTELFKEAFLLKLVECIFSDFRDLGNEVLQDYILAIDTIVKKSQNDVKKVYEKWDDIVNVLCDAHSALVKNRYANATDTELSFRKYLNKIKRLIEKIPLECMEKPTKIKISFELLEKSLDLRTCLEDVFKDYDNRDIELDYKRLIEYDVIGLSDGYEFISNLYGVIYACFKFFEPEKGQKIILTLDEPDCYMHPEWSRCLINDLYDFLYKEFKDFYFEIIITTHSPYILSDVPTDNVIFLENGKVKELPTETFGQNIHMLLKNSFFLNSTIGEFALRNIKGLFEELKSLEGLDNTDVSDERKQEFMKRIAMVGEPLVRRKLENIYKECFPENKDEAIIILKQEVQEKDDKIKALQQEILNLKERKND